METVEWVLTDQVLLHSSSQAGSVGQEEREKDMVLITALMKPAVVSAGRGGAFSRSS